MTKTVLKPDWAVATLRLDPARFPQQVTYGRGNGATDVAVTLDERGAVLKGSFLFRPAFVLRFARPRLQGVAARAIDHGDGQVTVTLELHHDDPDLCVPLLVAHDLCDIAADWRSWSEAYRIPMLMVEADGVARPLEEHLGKVRTQNTRPRRRHSYFADRRPRFLVRRSTGSLGMSMKIEGKEIIARS